MHMKLHGWKTVSGFLFTVAIAAVGGGSTGAELGCSTTASGGSSSGSTGSSSSGISPPTGCMADTSVDCSGGGDPFSCDSGDNPENEDPTLSCSTPQTDATTGGDDFCCFSEPSGDFSSSTCVPDDDITSVCPDPDSYGYQCVSGDDPSTLDTSLDDCSMGTPDADGVHDDFCCDLSGSGSSSSSGGSSSGGAPTGCMADSSVDCSGGGDPYSCDSGDNPENEDPTLSCSTPKADATTGGDDFCCFSQPSGDFSSSTCEPDDDITSVCPDPDSYGYQCEAGDDPSTLDTSLDNCSSGTPDSDGIHTDFCCSLN